MYGATGKLCATDQTDHHRDHHPHHDLDHRFSLYGLPRISFRANIRSSIFYDLARVAGWEPWNLHIVIPCVFPGFDLCCICLAEPAQPLTTAGEESVDLDHVIYNYLSGLSDKCSSGNGCALELEPFSLAKLPKQCNRGAIQPRVLVAPKRCCSQQHSRGAYD